MPRTRRRGRSQERYTQIVRGTRNQAQKKKERQRSDRGWTLDPIRRKESHLLSMKESGSSTGEKVSVQGGKNLRERTWETVRFGRTVVNWSEKKVSKTFRHKKWSGTSEKDTEKTVHQGGERGEKRKIR